MGHSHEAEHALPRHRSTQGAEDSTARLRLDSEQRREDDYDSASVAGLSGTWKQHEVPLQTGSVTPTTARGTRSPAIVPARSGSVWSRCLPPTFKNQPNGFRTAVTLAADPKATNSIDAAQAVAPVTSKVSGVRPGFTYKVPAHGIIVLTLEAR